MSYGFPRRSRLPLRALFLILISGFWLLGSLPIFAIVDTNDNGVSDLWEKQFNANELFPETLDTNADPDADSWTNAREAAAGTDPSNPNPPGGLIRPEIERIPAVMGEDEIGPYIITPAAVTVTWPTLAGKRYTLLFSVDLTAGSWLPVGDPFVGSGGDVTYGFPIGYDDKLFWRVAVSDIDTDGDGLTDHEEHVIGSSPYLADTDGDGIDDPAAYTAGLPLAGEDADDDGIPDNPLYTVEFEVQEKARSLPSDIGYEILTGEDHKHRYLTSTETEEYQVEDSAIYNSVTDGKQSWVSSYIQNGAIRCGDPVAMESGTSLAAGKLANERFVQSFEGLGDEALAALKNAPAAELDEALDGLAKVASKGIAPFSIKIVLDNAFLYGSQYKRTNLLKDLGELADIPNLKGLDEAIAMLKTNNVQAKGFRYEIEGAALLARNQHNVIELTTRISGTDTDVVVLEGGKRIYYQMKRSRAAFIGGQKNVAEALKSTEAWVAKAMKDLGDDASYEQIRYATDASVTVPKKILEWFSSLDPKIIVERIPHLD